MQRAYVALHSSAAEAQLQWTQYTESGLDLTAMLQCTIFTGDASAFGVAS